MLTQSGFTILSIGATFLFPFLTAGGMIDASAARMSTDIAEWGHDEFHFNSPFCLPGDGGFFIQWVMPATFA